MLLTNFIAHKMKTSWLLATTEQCIGSNIYKAYLPIGRQ
jgi:hypothetical protein